MEIAVSPRGKNISSLSPHVARAIALLQKRGLNHETHAMGTNVQGSIEDLFEVARQMHEAVFVSGIYRVVTGIKIDDRRDRDVSLADKTASLK